MKITEITPIAISLPMTRPLKMAGIVFDHSDNVLVRITTDGASAEHLRKIVVWAESHSPVADAIGRAVPKSTEVEIV